MIFIYVATFLLLLVASRVIAIGRKDALGRWELAELLVYCLIVGTVILLIEARYT